MKKFIDIGLLLAVAIFVLFTTIGGAKRLTEGAITHDARQNVTIAHNIVHHGVFSLGLDAPYKPTNYREPLPIYAMAAQIAVTPSLRAATLPELLKGPHAKALKTHNLFWSLLCLAGVAAVAWAAIGNRWLAAVGAAAIVYVTDNTLLVAPGVVDTIMTEVQATALMSWASFALILALRTGALAYFVASGVLVALLTLTKAIFLFVGLALVVILAALFLWRPLSFGRRAMAMRLGAMALAFALVVAPWLTRNAILFDGVEVAERGGAVLLIRAYKNQMTDLEYRGAYFAYAPQEFGIQRQIGMTLRFARSDMREGRRLERLNRNVNVDHDAAAERAGRPQDAVCFYHRARAERVRLSNYYTARGDPNPGSKADSELGRTALRLIVADPVAHLKATPLFLWRGTALFGAPLLIFALVGFLLRNPAMIGLAALPAGAVAFMALTTHFLPRYFEPMLPSTVLCFVFLIACLLSALGAGGARLVALAKARTAQRAQAA